MVATSNDKREPPALTTSVLPVDITKLGVRQADLDSISTLNDWTLNLPEGSEDVANLHRAARELQESDVPVAFPTETVYGLGADATRSSAVQGIYKAKQRPSDNPLIVHVHSLHQLRALLQPSAELSHGEQQEWSNERNGKVSGHHTINTEDAKDPIPAVYRALIRRFWPGPLTLIMPNPPNSTLAPEVTAGLPTFGVRMPRNLHALALLKLANVPLAAPSANSSSKPSPTEAKHVLHDLNGRISTIIDGGPCEVGVESTVIDGLSQPPSILRPGGVSIEELRSCPGWESVTVGYKDASESETQPRAPGMKYKHYSPKALVILYEHGEVMPTALEMLSYIGRNKRIGIIRTRSWPKASSLAIFEPPQGVTSAKKLIDLSNGDSRVIPSPVSSTDEVPSGSIIARKYKVTAAANGCIFDLWDINLGAAAEDIARGLFAALRELDNQEVDAILVEGIEDGQHDVSVAVMNRLRKAAEIKGRG